LADFGNLLAAIENLVLATPVLHEFSPWTGGYEYRNLPVQDIPAIALIENLAANGTALIAPVVAALRSVAKYGHWQQTYSEIEVGKDFLDRYGWLEVVGPSGHYHSDTQRIYLSYWGERLHYAWHLHEAEELYFILAGGAAFEAEGLPPVYLSPGQSRHHLPHQPHAMTTLHEPILALILWRGPGLDGSPTLSAG